MMIDDHKKVVSVALRVIICRMVVMILLMWKIVMMGLVKKMINHIIHTVF